MHAGFKLGLFLMAVLGICKVETTESPGKEWLPKVVWTFWDKEIPQDDHMHHIFEHNHKLMASGWEIRHINENTSKHWL